MLLECSPEINQFTHTMEISCVQWCNEVKSRSKIMEYLKGTRARVTIRAMGLSLAIL